MSLPWVSLAWPRGGNGFIGSYVIRDLQRIGASATVLDQEPGQHEGVGTLVEGICRPQAGSLIGEQKPEVVVHLAAQSRVAGSLEDPTLDAMTNIVGTDNVVTAAKKAGVARIVVAPSGRTAYGGRRLGHRLRKSTRCVLASQYGLSNATADAYLLRHAPDAGLSLAITNVHDANGFGVVAKFVDIVQHCTRPRSDGGSQTRDSVHVTDVSAAIVRARASTHTGSICISSGKATSITELLRIVAGTVGRLVDPLYFPNIEDAVLDNRRNITRARKVLGWRPTIDVAAGIRQLVAPATDPGSGTAGANTRWSR